MAETGDFNAGFSFDSGVFDEPTQPAWEFSGALAEARKELTNPRATTIDQKIQKRLETRKAFAPVRGGKVAATGGKGRLEEEDDDEDDEDDDEEDSDDDAPLPGEIDDDEEEEEEMDDDDDDEEVEEAQAPSKRQKTEAGAKAAAAKQQPPAAKAAAAKQQQQPAAKAAAKQQPARKEGKEGKAAASASAAATAGSNGFFAQTPEGTTFSAGSFSDLNLSRPLLKACAALGYQAPTPIQAACIPLALSGRDICGSAMTGSGKTAAFGLPILERLLHRPKQVAATYVLILTPTRELAVQIHSMIQKLAQYTDVQAALIVGGLSAQVQASVLRKSPEVVVATPGRLIDHLRNTQSVGLEDLAVLVLDEADRLLEMGFKEEIQEIVRMTPKKRQTMLFSATFSDQVRRLAALSLRQPVRLAADAAATVPTQLCQQIIRLKGPASALKEAHLMALCSRSFAGGRTIVFFRTKQRAHRAKILYGLLGLPPAAELHGDMTQAARLESLELFRQGQVAFLLATDVAARGLDISGVQVIVNYDAPRTLQTYLHRIGRTARAGAAGQSVTFIEDTERGLLKEVVKKTGVQMQQRVVPTPAVEQWQSRVESSSGDVWRVLKEEREEKELRQAEMEANKMQNMLEHEDEIHARPARTWFQSERQKKESKKRSASAAVEGDDGPEGVPAKGNGSKEERKARKKAEVAKKAQEEGSMKKKGKLSQETEEFSKAVKSVKSRVRELTQQGINPNKAAKIAAASVSGVKRKSKGSKKKPGAKGELFSGDGTGKPGESKDGSGSGKAAMKGSLKGKRVDSGGMVKNISKTELNKLKRGGKGKSAFKSKAKYKRK